MTEFFMLFGKLSHIKVVKIYPSIIIISNGQDEAPTPSLSRRVISGLAEKEGVEWRRQEVGVEFQELHWS